MITVLQSALKMLDRFTQVEQKQFRKAIDRFNAADPLARRSMLKNIGFGHFGQMGVKWSIRASRKHRVLIDWENEEYVVRAFVSRGDRKYYWGEK